MTESVHHDYHKEKAGGEKKEKGTHEELMKTCETYKQIATSQLSEEELNSKKEVDN